MASRIVLFLQAQYSAHKAAIARGNFSCVLSFVLKKNVLPIWLPLVEASPPLR
jgi:hypothetical protein